jgi:hypothetical protein
MLIEHDGRRPTVDPTAWVAPNAVVSGDVRIGRHSRVLFGAMLSDEGGPVELGDQAIVMQHAVVRDLDFPRTVFGVPREAPGLAAEATRRYARAFGLHRGDRVLDEG